MQNYTSAHTSINSTKLPRIYNLLDWKKLKEDFPSITSSVLDYGAGKYTAHIKKFVNDNQFLYFAYDPYNQSELNNAVALTQKPSIIICSNVLNTIDDDKTVDEIHQWFIDQNVAYFITTYMGNKSGIGKLTMLDCWQRNQRIIKYRLWDDEHVKKGVLTADKYIKYVK